MPRTISTLALSAGMLAFAIPAAAQPFAASPSATPIIADAPPPQPVVTVSASAQSRIPNDHLHAVLRAEADNADAAAAARDVNGRISGAMTEARSVPDVEISSAGYGTWQVSEPNRSPRWRVTQSIALDGSDFPAIAALVSRLQAKGLLLSGLDFSVSLGARRAAEDQLTGQAIRAWHQRADAAAKGFGARGWRAGRVSIQTSEGGGVRPMFRAATASVAAAPVAVEGGESEVTVTVTGEAVLDTVRATR